jgi:23S rRNA (adenine2503-C2)-methyltransferase
MQCNLAISLHASDDETRNVLMPINKKYNIDKLMEACRYYINKTNRRITYEYSLIKNINDEIESAEKLARLLKGQLCHVNLIPMNSVEGKEFEKPNREKVTQFKGILDKYGIEVTIRRELGSDIDAACGQLRRRNEENESSEDCRA